MVMIEIFKIKYFFERRFYINGDTDSDMFY